MTGTPEQVAAIAKAYRVIYEKVPGRDGEYTMNHTASVFLFDAKGGFAGTLAYQESERTARQAEAAGRRIKNAHDGR